MQPLSATLQYCQSKFLISSMVIDFLLLFWHELTLFGFCYISGPMTVADLAELMEEKAVSVIKFLMTDLGVMAAMTQSLDPATCTAVVEGFGMYVDDDDWDDEDDEEEDEE